MAGCDPLPWEAIDHVLLDMDGTLLDLHFDSHFWLEYLPSRYAQVNGLPVAEAKADLLQRYTNIDGSLQWYCIDHWSRELGLDIALLKREMEHLIAIHPHVIDFLGAVQRSHRRVVLVTNAHQKSLALKMEKVRLAGYFDQIICAHDLGLPKEDRCFWGRLMAVEPFDPRRTLFVDDSPPVLASAAEFGIRFLRQVLAPDSQEPPRPRGAFPAIRDFSEIHPEVQGGGGADRGR